MANASVSYTATGSVDTWAFSFSYLDEEHVKLYLDGVEDVAATFPTASSIQASGGNPANGVIVLVARETPRTSLITSIGNSGSIRNSDLNNQSLQALYVAEEARDQLDNTLSLDSNSVYWDADSKQIKNVAEPTAAQDAATKSYADTVSALQNVVDAQAAQTAAEAAQAAAEAAADNFDDVYLGSKASDPALDNDGEALAAGQIYFNTTSDVLKVYTGSAWEATIVSLSSTHAWTGTNSWSGTSAFTNAAGVTIGVDDDTPGILTLYGGGAGEEGGQARFYQSADDDGTYEYYRAEAKGGLLVLGTDAADHVTMGDTGTLAVKGVSTTAVNDGTKSSGTYTPAVSGGNFKQIVNGGSFTFDPPGVACTMVVKVTNNGSAGTITTSNFDKVEGDAFTTTDTDKFWCYITDDGTDSYLYVKAHQ